MKRIFASVNWTRVIWVLAAIFMVWSITLIISVNREQAEIAREAGVISKLNGIVHSIFALEKSLKTVGLDSSSRWLILYNNYRTRRAEFDPGDPNFRDLQVNLIRTDSLLIRIGRLHADWRRAETDLALQKSLEVDFYREINVATLEVQNAMQIMRQRSSRISMAMAGNGYALFGLVLVACALAAAVAWLLRMLQEDMAKIQEADTALRTGAERLRQIFEHAPLGMAMSTLEGKFIQVNPAFGKLLGYTEAELLGRQTAEVCHPDDLAVQHKLINRLQRGEIAAVQLEKRYLNKKQQTIYTLVQTSLIREADGAAPRLIEQVIDVTERQQEEFARRQSEERFREMVENIDEVFWLTDPAKNEVFYVNTAYEKIWSRSAQSLYETPQTWLEAIHPEDRERVRKAALTKQVIGQYDETYRIQRPDGETRWVRDRAFPIRDDQGSVYRLAGLAEDITERKQAEAAVHGGEQRWSLALEGSDAGVWDWEVRANKVFYSHRWKAMLGYQEHEIGDSLDECYSRVHPEDLPAMVAALEKHLRGETPIYISEHRKRCKDGRYKWVQDRGKVILRTAEGKPLRVVSLHLDIKQPGQAKAEPDFAASRLTAVIENLQFGILCEDKTRHVVYTNQKFCDMFSIPVAPAACTGMDCRVAAEQAKNIFVDQESFVPRIEAILKAQIQVMNEELRLQDGRIFERDYIPIFAEAEYIGHLWQYREVTAIKQAAEELRKSEEQFRLTFEVAPVGITISGIDGVLVQCNRAFCEMLGYTAAELQGKTWIDLTHPNDTSTNIAFRERLLRGDIADFQMQKRYLAKNGKVVYAQLHVTLIKDQQGRPLHFISQMINLTALKETRSELFKQSATLQSIVENMADGVVAVDMAGKFLVFNPAAESIMGVGATETSPPEWAEKYGLYLPDQITPFPFEQNPMVRAMQGEVVSAVNMFVRNAQRPRGVWLSITATPLRDEEGKVLGGIAVFRDVTATQQAEETLRKNEEQFRLTFEHAPIGMAISSIDGAILQVNQAYCDTLGRSAEEVIDHSVMEFTHPDDIAENMNLTRKLLRGEIPHYQIEKRYLAKGGHTVYAILQASLVRDREGNPLHFIGQIADITKRKLAEEELTQRTAELQEAHNSLNSVIEHLPAMLFMKDAQELRFIRFNRAGEEITGLKQEVMLGKSDYDFFPPEQADSFTAKDRAVLNGHSVVDIAEEPIQTPAGTKYLHTRKVPIYGLDGQPKYLLGISEDITERKAAEEALRRSEEQFRNMFELAPTGMTLAALDGTLLRANRAYCEMLGYTETELQKVTFLEITHADDIAINCDLMQKLLNGEIPHYQFEKRYFAKDGRIVHVILESSLVRDPSGNPSHFIGQAVDISARKQAEAEIRQLNAELEQRVIARTQEAQESEERFRALYDDNPSIYFTVDAEGTVLSVNRFGAEELGYATTELIDEAVTKIFAEEDHAKARQYIKTCLNNPGRSFTWELRMARKNESKLWVREYARAAHDHAGNPVVFVVCEDITSRRQAELLLQASEARLRKQNESLGDLVRSKTFQNGNLQEALQAVTEAAARCMEVERVSVWFYDVARTKIICRDLFELGRQQHTAGAELDQKDFLPYFAALSEGRDIDAHDAQNDYRTRCFREAYLRPLGITSMLDAPIRMRGELIGVLCHEHVGGQRQWSLDEQVFAASLADLVAQALEAHERERAELARRDSEERYRRLVEFSPDGIVIHDGATVIYVNSTARKMTGGAEAEKQTAQSFFSFLHPDFHETVKAHLRKVSEENLPAPAMEAKIVRHDQTALDVELINIPFVHEGRPAIQTIVRDISARNLAEQALRESEERYRTLVERMPDGIYRSTPDGRFVEVNPATYQMFGYANKDEFLALDASTQLYFHPDERNGAVPNLKKIEEGIAITRYRPKDGHEMWVEDHGRCIYDEQGKVIYNEGILRDITARKTAEAALQTNEERLRRQNEALRDLVSSPAFQKGNLQEVYQEITATVARCMNVARVSIWFYEEARTKIVCQSLYELNSDRHSKGLELLRQDFLPYFEALAEGRYIDAQDAQTDYRTRCFAEIYLKPLGITSMLDAPIRVGGNVIGVVCHEHIGPARHWTLDEEVFASSIADLAALAIESRQLEESETRFRTLIETMNDGLVQLDEKGLLIYVNDKMCEMTGFSREQMLGREVLPRLNTESRNILHDQIERRQTGESKPYEMEIRINGPGKLPVLVSPQPIFDFDGRFSGSFAVVTDISDRKRMEEQIRQHAEELERLVEERAQRIRLLEQQRAESEKLAATGRMSARIAHEINNPLAGIKNSFLLVKDGIPTTHRYYDYVRRIETEIERIARIVRQMFDLYRPQQDSVRSFPADLAIRDVVALLRTNCRERDITIDVEINTPALNVALSEGSLRQVLYNVIQNAIDASSPGGTVRVRAAAEQQQLTVSVIDQGHGIPEEIRPQIFEPFFTTKSGLERSGLGLGLSVSKGLVEAMGGKLDFESTVGKGTTFMITLPLDALHHKALATVAPPATAKNLEQK